MRVAVIGGTGELGSAVVDAVSARGHEVRIVSRTPPQSPRPGVEHCAADLATGSGLADACAGVDTVVDAVNSQRETQAVMVNGLRSLLAAEHAAGVGHHVEVSIVGCDLIPIGYFGAKVAQEKMLADGPVPWTLLRATQFHGFVAAHLAALARWRVAPRSRASFQPVNVAEVADRLADAVDAGPAGRVPDIGGPEACTLTDLSRIWQAAHRQALIPVHIPLPGRAGSALRDGAALLDRHGSSVGGSFADWIARS